MERDVFINALSEMGLPEGTVLNVIKPLYGITEAGINWYLNYLSHNLEKPEMKNSPADPCILIKRTNDDQIYRAVALQVGGSLGFGNT